MAKVNITNKKTISLTLIVIMFFAVLAGCFGDDEKKKNPAPVFTEVSGSDSMSGWGQGQGVGGGDSTVSLMLTTDINSSRVISVRVEIKFDDFDSDHAGTDDGSDPDEFSVSINSSGVESQKVTGKTPGTAVLELPASNATTDETVEFGPELAININANCKGGKKATAIPRPAPFFPIVYVDQGIAYSIQISYTYLE